MIRRGTTGSRPGLTLIEVLVALAIFLLSLGAITRLVTYAGQRALDARRTDEAARLTRSKFAEVFAGVVPLESTGDTPFDQDPDYSWSMSAESGSVSGIWVVTVTVKHKADDGPGFSLQQFVLDPTLRGSTQDTVTIAGAASTPNATGTTGSTGSSGANGSNSSSTPSGASSAPSGASASPSRAPSGGAPSGGTPSGGRSGPSSPSKR